MENSLQRYSLNLTIPIKNRLLHNRMGLIMSPLCIAVSLLELWLIIEDIIVLQGGNNLVQKKEK